jgi:type IV pilus assembly protein PilF
MSGKGPRSIGLHWAGCVLLWAVLSACVSKGGDPAAHSASQDELTKRAKARFELALAYYAQGQFEVALEELDKSIKADDDLVAAHNLRGLALGALGRDELADQSFRRALQLAPQDVDTLQNYAWFSCQRGRHAQAQSLFAQVLKVPSYRDVSRTQLSMGVCQARAGALREAEATLMQLYEREPGNPAVMVNLAEVLYRLGEYERARFQMRRVNGVAEWVSAQTLWLALRIENRLSQEAAVASLAQQLRSRFPQAPEVALLDRRKFDD